MKHLGVLGAERKAMTKREDKKISTEKVADLTKMRVRPSSTTKKP